MPTITHIQSTLLPDELWRGTSVILARLRARAPRVQCLTNTVGQPFTANVVLAVGARVSMANHPDEVVAMTASADALLINLGTLDAARAAAIPRLLADRRVLALPRVLDPVFVEVSPLRLTLAREIMAAGPLIVKGNAAEWAALGASDSVTRVKTGAIDHIQGPPQGAGARSQISIAGGHPWMAQVTGLGCAAGALIAACAAVEPDPALASAAALLMFAVAGEDAAGSATGPGSFAVAFLDAIAALDPVRLERDHSAAAKHGRNR